MDGALVNRVADLFQRDGVDAGNPKLTAEGITHMTQLLDRGAGPEVQFKRAQLRVHLAGLLPDAEQTPLLEGGSSDLSIVIKAVPHHAEALLCRGCLESKTNKKRALDDFQVASVLMKDPRANMARGLVFESNGNPQASISGSMQ